MNTMLGFTFFTSGITQAQNSTGTISAMSQRKPSTSFFGPEHQDVAHLLPGVGHGLEVGFAAVLVIHAVVELDGFKPVVDAGRGRKHVVAGGFGGRFRRYLLSSLGPFSGAQRVVVGGHHQAFAGQVVEVVVGGKGLGFVVLRAQVHHALRAWHPTYRSGPRGWE